MHRYQKKGVLRKGVYWGGNRGEKKWQAIETKQFLEDDPRRGKSRGAVTSHIRGYALRTKGSALYRKEESKRRFV